MTHGSKTIPYQKTKSHVSGENISGNEELLMAGKDPSCYYQDDTHKRKKSQVLNSSQFSIAAKSLY